MTATEMSAAVGHRTVTAEEISAFASLTGDYSRIHLDHEFSRASGMGGLVAHGLLGASWVLGALTLHAPERLGVGEADAYVAGYSVRFAGLVLAGDTLSFRWCDDAELSTASPSTSRATAFEVLNQRDEVVTRGSLTVTPGSSEGDAGKLPDPPTRWSAPASPAGESPDVYYAEDIFERGPRGETLGRSVTESDVVGFTGRVGELNPLYLNREFAVSSRFGVRIAPPMMTFCLGFAEFLREFLKVPMPSSGFAGHLGDRWNFYRPVEIGDTIRTLHKPVSCRRSRSRPEMSLVGFGLQMVNQHDVVVQDGEVTMMIPGRTEGS